MKTASFFFSKSLTSYPFPFLLQAVFCFLMFDNVKAQPGLMDNSLSVDKIISTASNPVRIDRHPLTNELFYMTAGGDIYKVDIAGKSHTKVFSKSEHGLHATTGFEIGQTGVFYLVQAAQTGGNNIATIMKGIPEGEGYKWVKMAQTEPYRASGNRDHQFNAIIESVDGSYLLINSGSRTDHGEEAKNGGREMPITSAIIRLPANAENVVIPNNEADLKTGGFIFADGTRNTYDLEYAPNGDLFGAENSDTRDNEEELNWLQEGEHYGFPWQIGTHNNPQQYPDYNPPGSDNLLVQGINHEATFYNDPAFPTPPPGINFRKPVTNTGPDAAIIRDSVDGKIKNAIEIGRNMGTFTPHSSPLALTFDSDSLLAAPYTGGGFIMSYNKSGNTKFTPFGEPGEDLLYLRLNKHNGTYTTSVNRIAKGFTGPVDAVLIQNKLYVLEYGGAAIWEVSFPAKTPVEAAVLTINKPDLAEQTVIVNTSIEAVIFEWENATSVSVEGLPPGVTAEPASESKTITIQGSPTLTGAFNYTVSTLGGSPNDSFTGTITVLEDAGITGYDLSIQPGMKDKINLSPNPFSDKLEVHSLDPQLLIRRLIIYNTAGSYLTESKGNSAGEFSLNVSSFLPGVYFIRIETNKGSLVKKAIKVN